MARLLAMNADLQFVVDTLKAKTKTYQAIEAESGVPFSTLRNIATGRITNPTLKTLQALVAWARAQECSDTQASSPISD